MGESVYTGARDSLNANGWLNTGSSHRRLTFGAILVGVGYYLGARFGIALSFPPDYISVLWPPNAVLLTALLCTAPRYWFIFLLVSIPAEFAADLPAGINWPTIIGFILADWIEVLVAAFLLRRLTKTGLHFQSLRNVIAYLVVCVLIAPFVSAFPGAASNYIFSNNEPAFWIRFVRWFMSDSLTHLTVTGTLYSWMIFVISGSYSRLSPVRTLELLLLGISLFLTGGVAMGAGSDAIHSIPTLLYSPLPVLLWAAVRFGPRGSFSAALIITIIGILSALNGYGPFIHLSTPYQVLNIQGFLIISLTPLIVLSAVIEEQKVTRQRIRESEKKIRQITEFLPETIFEMRLDGKLTYVNQSGFDQFGYEKADLEAGLYSINFLVPDDIRRGNENIEKVLQGENLGLQEYRARRKDGTEFPVLIQSSPIVEQGRTLGLRGFVVDISERKKMEDDLRESEAKYRQILQYAPAGIYEVDFESDRFVDFNEVLCQYTGYERSELSDLKSSDLLTAESRQTLARIKADAVSGKPVKGPVEYEIRAKDNRRLWVLVNYRFHYDEKNEIRRATAVVHDITEKKRIEAESRALEMRLHQSQKMESLGTLAGGIAHDFNNLLTGIQGNASLLKRHFSTGNPDHEKLSAIEELVQRASLLTKQLLGLARGGKYEVVPADINRLVQDEARLFGRTRKDITIHTALGEDIAIAEVDRGQIEQVLLNLFVNAAQAMPEGGDIYLKTQKVHLDEQYVRPFNVLPGVYVQISVTDTGIGMNEAVRQKIFDPFFTTRQKQRGTGLGLASAYGIVKNHGGIIDVKSAPNRGATFDIYLPASAKAGINAAGRQPVLKKGKETVLLIDDEDFIRSVGKEMLLHLGYHAIVAPDGQTGISLYEKERHRIDLVLLDMIMPRMSGRETFERLKAIDPDVRIVLISGYSLDSQASEIMSHGCCGFIQKPFDLNRLSAKIREALED